MGLDWIGGERRGMARQGLPWLHIGVQLPNSLYGRGLVGNGVAWPALERHGYIIGAKAPTVYKGKDRWGRAGHGKARHGRATHWGESPDSLPELKLKLKRERSKR